MKNKIIELSKQGKVDEIRFINTDDLTEEYIGDLGKFAGRQPKEIMPEAKTVIVFSTYIGKFVTDFSARYGRTSRLVLSGYYANIVKPLIPIQEFLISEGYKAHIVDGESDEVSIP
ncbi:hypothetical protein [Aminipila terrae]|uniref:Uncharacterized protein n=1 Tax=Aminipila terrae TaxID=2697030 RepID=A0A6P1MIE4_9FIRM|nr:hypothetical protein [Aminipila terrae]QHI71758.1 hypothetical protein Ami3637_04580 [Aminipila terrae]